MSCFFILLGVLIGSVAALNPCWSVCKCDYTFKMFNCVQKGLAQVPDFNEPDKRLVRDLRLDFNFISDIITADFGDRSKWMNLRFLSLVGNPVSCAAVKSISSLYLDVKSDCVFTSSSIEHTTVSSGSTKEVSFFSTKSGDQLSTEKKIFSDTTNLIETTVKNTRESTSNLDTLESTSNLDILDSSTQSTVKISSSTILLNSVFESSPYEAQTTPSSTRKHTQPISITTSSSTSDYDEISTFDYNEISTFDYNEISTFESTTVKSTTSESTTSESTTFESATFESITFESTTFESTTENQPIEISYKWFYVSGGIGGLIFIVFVVVLVCCLKYKKQANNHSLLNNSSSSEIEMRSMSSVIYTGPHRGDLTEESSLN